LVGYFEKYEKITKFRLDRITNLEILEEERIPQQDDFSIADFFEKEFSMLE
jgi:predicted DNA-binding transcriptional regulator YafY